MPHPLLNPFISFIDEGKTSCPLKIDQGEEEKQQNGVVERGPIDYHLPEELVIERILTRLPARDLAVCSCVSKLWYNSIFNDSRFSAIHYDLNKNRVFHLIFNLGSKVRGSIQRRTWFFSLLGRGKEDSSIRFLSCLNIPDYELVGFCNGLGCIKLVSKPNDYKGFISVVNPIRCESLVLSYVIPTGGIYLCHGFGFDLLSKVYKAVIIYVSEAKNEFLCMVITLGTLSWRKIIITSTFDISPPPVSSPFRVPRISCEELTLCGGDLFWVVRNQVPYNNKIEMLLSFDLHNEKIHFIRLPAECNNLTTATREDDGLSICRLLGFKGYPCIARSEKIVRSKNDHRGHRCNYKTGVCCCCYKVHMYILKDKDEQAWAREETFDVQIMDKEDVVPTPVCCYFDSSAMPGTPAIPVTRILTFSDQVLLYWFNGERLVFYNLQEKHLKVVECSLTYPSIFQTKIPYLDYQLHAQVENMVSLKTFIPEGAKTIETDCADECVRIINNNLPAGWLTTGRKTHTFYAFS